MPRFARLALLASLSVALFAQPPATFTVVVWNDIHTDSAGNTVAGGHIRDWIVANKTARNITGFLSAGDEIADPLSATGHWTDVVGLLTDIHNAGIPVVTALGNHDVAFFSAPDSSQWNFYIAPLNAAWASHVSSSHFTGGLASANEQNVNVYFPWDVVTASGTIHLAGVAVNMNAAHGDISDVRALMDADTTRQYILTTHMFVSTRDASNNPVAAHTCLYGEEFCVATNAVGAQDAVDMWADFSANPRILAMMSGHEHLQGFYTMAGSGPNPVIAMENFNAALNGGTFTILNFRPADRKIDLISSQWNSGTSSFNETTLGTYDWTPILSSASSSALYGGGLTVH